MSEQRDYAAAFEEEEGKIKIRYLEEIDLILGKDRKLGRPAKSEEASNEVNSYRSYANLLKAHLSFISEVKSGRYKVNIRTIWITKKYFPNFDIEYILFGIRSKKATGQGSATAPRSPQASGSD